MSTSTEALVERLEARGVRFRERGGKVVVAPRDWVSPPEWEALRAAKPDVLRLIRSRAVGADWSRVGLWSLDRVLEVDVPWSEVRLLIAPGCRIARALREQDPSPGRVWCVCEVSDLLLTNVPPSDAQRVAEARLLTGGVLESIVS